MLDNRDEVVLSAEALRTDGLNLAMGKWHSLLADGLEINDEWRTAATAQVLENTWVYLTAKSNLVDDGCTRKFLFPLVRSVIPNLLAWHFLSVQAMPTPSSMCFRSLRKRGEPPVFHSDVILASSNKLSSRYSLETLADLKAVHGLEAEAEMMGFLAEQIRFELDALMIKTIQESCTSVKEVAFGEESLKMVARGIRRNLDFPKGRFWILVDGTRKDETMKWASFKTNVFYQKDSPYGLIGTLDEWCDIFHWPYLLPNTGLFGFRGEYFFDAGGVVAPYLLATDFELVDLVKYACFDFRMASRIWDNRFFRKLELR